jgi:hypothetical protein
MYKEGCSGPQSMIFKGCLGTWERTRDLLISKIKISQHTFTEPQRLLSTCIEETLNHFSRNFRRKLELKFFVAILWKREQGDQMSL